MSNRPISVVELERRRLATAASLSKDLEAITAWGLKNMVEFNASKTQYCTLSNKRCPSEHLVLMNNQALQRSHSFKLLGVSITANMIWHEHVDCNSCWEKARISVQSQEDLLTIQPSHAIQSPDKT
nr:unnamed protein product [Callosobruchus chinensis]